MIETHHPVAAAPLFEITNTTSIHDGDATCDAPSLRALVNLQLSRLVQAGVGPTDRVVLFAPKSVDYCALLLAIFSLGAIAVPLFHGLKQQQLEHVLKDCRPKVIFTSRHGQDTIGDLPAATGCCIEIIEPDCAATTHFASFPPASFSGQLPAAIIYTSGSTGLPKGVVFSRENLCLGAQSVAAFVGLGRDDCVLCVLPFSFDAGLMCLFSAVIAGSRIVLANFIHASQIKSLCQRWQATSMTAVPGLWSKLAEIDWKDSGMSLRSVCNTGGHLNERLAAALGRLFPKAGLIPMYGFTEAFRCCYMPAERAKLKPGSVGHSIPHSSFAVISKSGELCKPGEAGELVQFGPLVTLGYWNNPTATADKFRPVNRKLLSRLRVQDCAPYRIDPAHLAKAAWSGDLVKIDEDGDLYFIARNDDMMKVNGFRVSPFEIENVCVRQGCTSAFAYALHSERGDEILLVHSNNTPEHSLREGLARALPAYMLPRHFVALDDLPINNNGKFDRSQIRALAKSRLDLRT